jgi:hypothetical protein
LDQRDRNIFLKAIYECFRKIIEKPEARRHGFPVDERTHTLIIASIGKTGCNYFECFKVIIDEGFLKMSINLLKKGDML